jgi:subtilase family serine protease
MRQRLLLIAALAAALVAVTTPLSLNGAVAAPTDVASCAPAGPGEAGCLARRATDHHSAKPAATRSFAGGYAPADLVAAYSVPAGGAGRTIAIVDAYDNPTAEADLAAYRSQFALPVCSTANGCFRKVNQRGAAAPLPAGNVGWGTEIALDLDMASAICPKCALLLVEADSTSLNALGAAVDTAARLGANVISNSYGGSEFSSEASFQSHWNHPGIAITASSGDSGYGVQFPAASSSVVAVGGTRLVRSSTTRGWTETAWSGAGSGCSRFISKPSWQKDTGCGRRTVADLSAVADPSTGVAVYDSYGSSGGNNWFIFGGTSVAAPIVAAMYAVAGNTSTVYNPSAAYKTPTSLWDVTSGSNGNCGASAAYLCKAGTGYDGPTGMGTPHGIAAF